MAIHTLSIDLETFSDVDLKKCGVYKYAESPNFEILLFGVSVDGGEVTVYDLASGGTVPEGIIRALSDDSVIKWAYNASFERVCLSVWLRRNYPQHFSSYSIEGDTVRNYLAPSSWRCSLVWGAYMGLQFSITAIGAIILQSAVNALGSSVVASISASNRVQNILTCPLETMGATMATYCSQNYGANRIDRVRQGIRQATIVTAVYSVVGLAIAYFCGRTIAQMFISAEETALLDSIRQFLTINGIFYFPLAIILVYRNSLQGLGFSNSAMLAGVFELVARSAVAWLLVGTFGFIAVCFANPAAWIAADCLLLPMYAKKIRVLSRWQAARERLESMQAEYEAKLHA